MVDHVLHEQLNYYRSRASEYDESLQARRRVLADEASAVIQRDMARAQRALHGLGPFEHVLELACGTGTWTKELTKLGRRVTALDGSPEVLAIARTKVGDAPVEFVCADIFTWRATTQYDL